MVVPFEQIFAALGRSIGLPCLDCLCSNDKDGGDAARDRRDLARWK
jgi:hypothetical protein